MPAWLATEVHVGGAQAFMLSGIDKASSPMTQHIVTHASEKFHLP